MDEISYLGYLIPETVHTPSEQMVIRRYRPLNEEYIRSFFEDGLYCRSVTKYDDDNEGLLGDTVEIAPAVRGGLAAMRGMKTRRNAERGIPGPDPNDLEIDPEDWKMDAEEFHQIVRRKFFANCWRFGTDESEKIWKEYTGDEDMINGFAFETTVGQFIRAIPSSPPNGKEEDTNSVQTIAETDVEDMYAGQSGTDIFIGAVRYQDRQAGAIQPAFYQAAINFYKSKEYDDEREFRFLINPFDTSYMMTVGQDGKLQREAPELSEYHRFFPMDTSTIVNRIVMAPNSGKEQREKIESVLDDIGIRYDSEGSAIQIINSTLSGKELIDTHTYGAEIEGLSIYEDSSENIERRYNEYVERFMDQAGKQGWDCLDICSIATHHSGQILEVYKHQSNDPGVEVSDYGYNAFQAIEVTRMYGIPAESSESASPPEPVIYTNDRWDNIPEGPETE